jgi:hypothetical protein
MPDVTSPSDAAAFVAHWARIGPVLEIANRQEQQRLTDEGHLIAVANVLSLARPEQPSSQTSGLVEQQRLFSLGRK